MEVTGRGVTPFSPQGVGTAYAFFEFIYLNPSPEMDMNANSFDTAVGIYSER